MGEGHVLGLATGSRNGNSETLLKEALMAAEEAGATTEIVRVNELEVPPLGHTRGPNSVADHRRSDDGAFIWERILECDGLIISSPVYTRCPPGKLKALGDAVLGPQADVAFQMEFKRLKAEGDPRAANADIDERIFKPRCGAFIAVGGATSPEWASFGLPLLHLMTFSMQIAIVDQVQILGYATPGAVAVDESVMARVHTLGAHVAEQLGRPFDDTEYRGEPGLCPDCHLNMMILTGVTAECAVCGMRGTLALDGGDLRVTFPEQERRRSLLTLEGKRQHLDEIMAVAAQAPSRETVTEHLERYTAFESRVVAPGGASTG